MDLRTILNAVTVIQASGAAQTLTASLGTGEDPVYDLTLTANCTITLAAAAAGRQQAITLYARQDSTGGRALTLPAGVLWPAATVPALTTTAGRMDVLRFTTLDGATWIGGVVALNLAAPAAPAPIFTTPASITTDGTPSVGEELLGVDGVVTGGSIVSRRWLLGSTVLATTLAYTPGAAGVLTFESRAEGPGGATTSSAQVTVAEAPPVSGARTMAIGANLDGISYFGDCPFIDRIRSADRFTTFRKADGAEVSLYDVPGATFDSDGWPTAIPNTHERLVVRFQCHRAVEGDFTYHYEAQNCDLRNSYLGPDILTNSGYTQMSGTFTTTTPHADGWASFNISAISPGFRLKVCRAEHVARMQAGELFDPTFVATWAAYSGPIRTMNWGPINGSKLEHWADRPLPGHFSWATPNPAPLPSPPPIGQRGVPLEVQVALANATGRDLFWNVPTMADDDFVTRAITYIRDNLTGKLFLEHSNEVWNSGHFSAYNQLQARADAIFGGRVWNGFQYQGYRAAQIAAIAVGLYTAAGKRFRLVSGLGAQWVAIGAMSNVLPTTVWPGGAPAGSAVNMPATGASQPGDLFDVFFVATYCGGNMTAVQSSPQAQRDWILGLVRDTDREAAFARAFRQWEYGDQDLGFRDTPSVGRPDIAQQEDQSFAGMYAQMDKWRAFAASHSMGVMAYEGQMIVQGFEYVWGTTLATEIAPFLRELHARPEMEGLTERFYRGLAARGLEMLAIYKHINYSTAAIDLSGFFGNLLYAGQPRGQAPRYRAVQKLKAAPAALTIAPAPLTLTPSTVTARVGASQRRTFAHAGGRAPLLLRAKPGTTPPQGRALSLFAETGTYEVQGQQDYTVQLIDSEGTIVEAVVAQDVAEPAATDVYRYWRLDVTATSVREFSGPGGQGDYVHLAELVFLDAHGAVIAHGDPAAGVTDSGHYNGEAAYAGAKVFDGDPTTAFSSTAGLPVYIRRDYGNGDGRRPASIRLRARGGYVAGAPTKFAVVASVDGTTWDTIADKLGDYAPVPGKEASNRRGYDSSDSLTVACTYPA